MSARATDGAPSASSMPVAGMGLQTTLENSITNTENIIKVRKHFPETWLWNTTLVGYRLYY